MVRFVTLICLNLLLVIPTKASDQKLTQDSTFFDGEQPLSVRISGDLRSLFRDRSDDPSYFPLSLSYTDADSNIVEVKLKAKTRGHFRLKIANCSYPPLLLNFSKNGTPEQSIFRGLDKVKLVVPCMGEEFVIKEYLLYKIYNLFTPYSFNVRLLHLEFNDLERGKVHDPQWAFILEEDEALAERNESKEFKRHGLKGKHLDRYHFLLLSVFEYFIGNTDWSVEYRHNVKLVVNEKHSLPVPVPYDFDHAGAVAAPYAKPSEALKLASVQQRRYRGFCLEDLDELESIFSLFEDNRAEIRNLVNESLLSDRTKRRMMEYLESFFETLEDRKRLERDFTYPCLEGGTGNVVIRGLRDI